jgi:dihydrofolate reductase
MRAAAMLSQQERKGEHPMGNVIVGATLSLDGFMSDRHGDISRLYPDLEALRRTEMLQEEIRTTGAVVMGRRAYDMGEGDLTDYEYQVPIFVLTHHLPEKGDAIPIVVCRRTA